LPGGKSVPVPSRKRPYPVPLRGKKKERAERRAAARQRPVGWIYTMRCSAIPGLMKVGRTSRAPGKRLMEHLVALHDRGVRNATVEMWACASQTIQEHEAAVLMMLDDVRLPGERETFRCPAERVLRAMATVTGSEPVPLTRADCV
jgi:hypothetical protein